MTARKLPFKRLSIGPRVRLPAIAQDVLATLLETADSRWMADAELRQPLWALVTKLLLSDTSSDTYIEQLKSSSSLLMRIFFFFFFSVMNFRQTTHHCFDLRASAVCCGQLGQRRRHQRRPVSCTF